ncbi:MAG: hypothetical protein QW525_04855 [Thermoplasmatales archaeon]
MTENYRNSGFVGFLLNSKINIGMVLAFITFFLIISPLLPGVTWFNLGDFTLDTVNWYHTIMIPFAFLLILYITELLDLGSFAKKAINFSTIPILLFTVLGMAFFYSTSALTADIVFQAIRDIWMIIVALIFLVYLIIMPFKNTEKFKKIWGAYALIVVATISAGIASVMGMIYEYGALYGFASIPAFNSYVNAWGGLQTFLGNLVTSHSHEMLPAVMGGIVAVAAVAMGYDKLEGWKRHIVNAGMLIALAGTISMTYLYMISSFGTYVIPAIFTFGPGGVNGLALDDSQTGMIGWGALIAIIGLYYIFSSNRAQRLVEIAEVFTWIATMAVLIAVGYSIEFNEAYYGFGSPGTPPNGGPGYLYDMAFMNGHLVFAFFMMPLIAGILLVFLKYVSGMELITRVILYIIFAGIVLGGFGVLVYTMTLFWQIQAIGVALLVISILLLTAAYFAVNKPAKASSSATS